VYASFTSDNAQNLVTFKNDIIDIYTIFSKDEHQPSKLILEASVPVYGVVKDIGVARFSGSSKDVLGKLANCLSVAERG
jgi:hypothetical protein